MPAYHLRVNYTRNRTDDLKLRFKHSHRIAGKFMSDDVSKNLSRLADNMKHTANEKMIPLPHMPHRPLLLVDFQSSISLKCVSNIQSKIHTYFSFFNPNNLTVLETMNLSHSCELYACQRLHMLMISLNISILFGSLLFNSSHVIFHYKDTNPRSTQFYVALHAMSYGSP